MDNKLIAERLFHLQATIQHKNNKLARVLQSAIVAVLEHPHPLHSATRETLRRVRGMRPNAVEWSARIIAGESIDRIAADVPEIKRIPGTRIGGYRAQDRGNWDGSWDNIIKVLEGE